MLASVFIYLFSSFGLFLFFLVLFGALYYNTRFVFVRIWLLFLFFLVLNLILGYTGEDFFVVLALMTEVPVFFGFFFFYIVKNELADRSESFFNINKTTLLVFFICLFFSLRWVMNSSYVPDFSYWTPDLLVFTPTRSDFFFYYFYFLYASNSIVFFLGLMITLITFIILFITYQYQIADIEASTIAREKKWARTQDASTQTTHNQSTIFFKL